MFNLPLFRHAQPSQEPFSRQTAQKASRLRGATVTEGVCPYCAVGCGQLIYTKAGKVIDIEGHPESPINEGTLCPKGADAFQLAVNPHRITHVLYRAPFSDHWERKPLDWALEQIARRVRGLATWKRMAGRPLQVLSLAATDRRGDLQLTRYLCATLRALRDV